MILTFYYIFFCAAFCGIVIITITVIAVRRVTGFSRAIPGFPTYHVEGSVSLGQHNLVIESAQLSDDAEFQCQVTPAGGDPPLMGAARLTVLGQCWV